MDPARVLHACPNCGCDLQAAQAVEYGNIGTTSDGGLVFEGRPLALTARLHAIVHALVSARGRGLTRAFLASRLTDDLSDEAIVKSVERVRRFFRGIDPAFDQIETVRGFGAYRWIFRPPAPALFAE